LPNLSPREQLLRLAREALTREAAAAVAGALVEVIVRAPGVEIVYRERPGELDADLTRLPPLERALLAVCTHQPQPRKVLAKLAGKRLNSRVHAAVRELLGRGLIVEDYRGVRRS